LRAIFLLAAFSIYAQAQPVINAITNSASYTGRVATGGLATIFGTGLADSTIQASTVPLPVALAGTNIYLNGVPCPLLYVSATQINFQVPYEVGSGSATLALTATLGLTTPVTIQVDEAAPALFQYGTNQALAVNYTTSDINGADTPVESGDYLIVYLTGVGPVSSTPADGGAAGDNPPSSATDSYTATIGGVDATVSFLGLTPGLVALGQANVRVPSLANGNYPLVITVNGVTSTSAVVSVSGTGTVQPDILTYVSSVGLPTGSLQSNVHGSTTVQVNGQYAYVCSVNQITAVDVSNPRAPTAVSAFGQTQLNGQGTNCIISNNYLVELVNASNYLVFDLLSSATSPTVVSGPTALSVPLAGNLAFDGSLLLLNTNQASWYLSNDEIIEESGSLEAYDFSNFTSPVFDSTFSPPSGFTSNNSPRFQLAAINSQYIATMGTTNGGGEATSGQGVFDVLDVSNPANILGVVEVPIPGAVVAQSIALQGSEALITGNTQAWNNPITYDGSTPEFLNMGDLTLSLVDFTNPQNPNLLSTVVTTIQSSGGPSLASLGGGFFAVSGVTSFADFNGAGALAVVDATDPSNPNWISIATIDGVSSIYVQSGYLYVATGAGLNLYQINSPR